jgi:hypothetical protein
MYVVAPAAGNMLKVLFSPCMLMLVLIPAGIKGYALLVAVAVPLRLAQQAAEAITITRVLVIGGVVTAVELENEYDIVILKFLDITVI